MATLYTLPYSPWSEKARWALDHHKVSYVEKAHVPLVGELGLRIAAKKLRGKVSVPLFVDDEGEAHGDSLAIARYAESVGRGTPLFPAEDSARILEWHRLSEVSIAAARERVMARTLKSPEALRELAPPLLRALPFSAASTKLGVAFIARKYGVTGDGEESRDTLARNLRALSGALSGERSYITGHFSYADICGAAMVQCVAPVADEYIPLGVGSRGTWTDEGLAAEFGDLVGWRDQLYRAYRKGAGRRRRELVPGSKGDVTRGA